MVRKRDDELLAYVRYVNSRWSEAFETEHRDRASDPVLYEGLRLAQKTGQKELLQDYLRIFRTYILLVQGSLSGMIMGLDREANPEEKAALLELASEVTQVHNKLYDLLVVMRDAQN